MFYGLQMNLDIGGLINSLSSMFQDKGLMNDMASPGGGLNMDKMGELISTILGNGNGAAPSQRRRTNSDHLFSEEEMSEEESVEEDGRGGRAGRIKVLHNRDTEGPSVGSAGLDGGKGKEKDSWFKYHRIAQFSSEESEEKSQARSGSEDDKHYYAYSGESKSVEKKRTTTTTTTRKPRKRRGRTPTSEKSRRKKTTTKRRRKGKNKGKNKGKPAGLSKRRRASKRRPASKRRRAKAKARKAKTTPQPKPTTPKPSSGKSLLEELYEDY